jgi:hypothetical protein
MNKTIEHTVSTDQESVSRLAYQLWENAGRPASRDLEFWLLAEAQVRTAGSRPTARREETAPATSPKEQAHKAPRAARGGIKKTWPKPYPSLPKF